MTSEWIAHESDTPNRHDLGSVQDFVNLGVRVEKIILWMFIA